MSKVIKLGQYTNIEVEVERTFATEEEIQGEIDMILSQSTLYEDKEGAVENGDMTIIDFEGFKDGVAFDGGKGEDYQLLIGSHTFIPGFEEQMIGMEKGETRDLNVTFPENYGAKELAGAPVVFKVTVHNIQKEKKAELTDEFVSSFNVPGVTNVEEFKARISADVQNVHDQKYRSQVENAVFAKVLADSEVEVNEEDINKAIEQHINYLTMQLASQGMQLEQYLQFTGSDMDALKEQLAPSAKQQAEFEAVIDEVARVENLDMSDEEVEMQLDMIAAQNNVSKEEVLEKVNKEDLKRDYKRIKASQFIIDSAAVK